MPGTLVAKTSSCSAPRKIVCMPLCNRGWLFGRVLKAGSGVFPPGTYCASPLISMFHYTSDSQHAGKGLPCTEKAPAQTDSHLVQALLRRHKLTALNTWPKGGPASATFVQNGQPATQIDFIIMRIQQAGPLSKQSRPCAGLPFVPTTGMYHLPVQARIPCPNRPAHAKPVHKPTTCTGAKRTPTSTANCHRPCTWPGIRRWLAPRHPKLGLSLSSPLQLQIVKPPRSPNRFAVFGSYAKIAKLCYHYTPGPGHWLDTQTPSTMCARPQAGPQ